MKVSTLLFLLFAFLFNSCQKNPNEAENPVKPLSESEKQVISRTSDFAFRLFKSVVASNPGRNVFISPMSVSFALSMAMNGANSETLEAMSSTLGFDTIAIDEINQAFKEVFTSLSNLDRNVELQVANSLWCRLGINFEQEFLNTLAKFYNAYAEVLDFASPQAKDKINKWVEEKTKGKIKEIIKGIPNYAVMYIINALYFKGQWKYQFDKNKTSDGDFMVYDNYFVKTKYMLQIKNFECYFDKEFSSIRIPYGKGNFAMVVLFPNSEFDIDLFIANLNREKWENCLNKLIETKEVTLYIPKFKNEFEVNLTEILKSMGMSIAFSESADFSKLCKSLRCQITDVLHKTYIEVDEEGTEAAASTSVEIGYTSYKPAFYLTRPFVYIIYEKNTGAILFIGKLYNPSEN